MYAGSGLPGQGQWEGRFFALLGYWVDKFVHNYVYVGCQDRVSVAIFNRVSSHRFIRHSHL